MKNSLLLKKTDVRAEERLKRIHKEMATLPKATYPNSTKTGSSKLTIWNGGHAVGGVEAKDDMNRPGPNFEPRRRTRRNPNIGEYWIQPDGTVTREPYSDGEP